MKQSSWPANIVDRLLFVAIGLGFVAFLRVAMLADYAFNDWGWVDITRSWARWLDTFSYQATVRITSQILLGTSYSLLGHQAFVPGFVLGVTNVLGAIPAARILQKFGFSTRAAWLAAASGILCSANGDVALFLAQSETAVGRTLVLTTLWCGLAEESGALWYALPWLVLAFATHEFSLYILPMLVFAIVMLHGAAYLRTWSRRPDTIVFTFVWTILTIIRFMLAARSYDPQGSHTLSLAAIPENIAYWGMKWLAFTMADRALPIVLVIAVLLGIRARDINWRLWIRRILPVSIAWAFSAYGLYFLASSYRSSYFFVFSAIGVAAPLGWLADRALQALEEKPRRAMVLAVVIAASVVAPVSVMSVYPEEKHALRAVREAARSAVLRAPDAAIHCAWIVSSSGRAKTSNDISVSALIDVERPEHSTMLTVLHPTTEFVIVEVRADQLRDIRPTVEDVIIRFDHDAQFMTPQTVSRSDGNPKTANDCRVIRQGVP